MRQSKLLGTRNLALVVAFAAAQACSSDAPPVRGEQVQQASGSIQVASANGCTVEWVRINYDTPGADSGEFIELRVVNSGSSATTLGACGLSSIRLVNDGDCGTYNTINLASVAIPNDGVIVICDSTQITGGVCDVNVSAGATGFIQNGGPDHISFVSGNGGVTLHATYEGASGCLPDGGAAATVLLPTDSGGSPDQVVTWCNNAWVLQDVSISGPGMALNCTTDAGTDASTGGTGGTATGGTGGTATGGTGGAATGGTGGTATGGTGGTATGGTGGSATGGTGGTATGGTGGTATGGTGGTATGGTGGSATGGTGGAATGGTGGTATGGTGGAATGGTGGTATGGGGSGGASGSGGVASGGGGAAGSSGSAGAGGASGGSGGGGGAPIGGSGGAAIGGSGGAKFDAGMGGNQGSSSGDDGSCACSTPGGAPASRGAFALVALALAGLWRRRRSAT